VGWLRELFPWWLYRPTVISIGCSVAAGCCVGGLDWLLGRLY
jgi:hypothetical protein